MMQIEVSVFEEGNEERVDGFKVDVLVEWVRSLVEGDWLIFPIVQTPPSVGGSFTGTRKGDYTCYELKRRIMEFNDHGVPPRVLLHVYKAN